jgi:SAM-dependent methyltransferase
MYTKSARFYDQLYHFKDYEAACRQLHAVVQELRTGSNTLLDVACSTGRHLQHLQRHYAVHGLDLNPDLLAIARQRCPNVPFHRDDMIDFDLGMRFDVVTCLFSSIAYARTVDNLHATFRAFARHLNPRGLLLVEPWVSPEQYWDHNIVLNTAEAEDQKIAWMYVGQRTGTLVTNDIQYMVGTPEGVSSFSERHEMGLFRDDDYVSALGQAGLRLLSYDRRGFFGNGLYVATLEPATH